MFIVVIVVRCCCCCPGSPGGLLISQGKCINFNCCSLASVIEQIKVGHPTFRTNSIYEFVHAWTIEKGLLQSNHCIKTYFGCSNVLNRLWSDTYRHFTNHNLFADILSMRATMGKAFFCTQWPMPHESPSILASLFGFFHLTTGTFTQSPD